jgi:PAS domain S-box-containing protein
MSDRAVRHKPRERTNRSLASAALGPSAGGSDGDGWDALFWVVFERSSNPCIILDEHRRVIELNAAALALLGGSRMEVLGASMVDRVATSERGRAASAWYSLLRTGEAFGSRHLTRSDGSHVEVQFAASLTRIRGRLVALYVVLAADHASVPVGGHSVGAALTLREREVVTLIALGLETADIGAQLYITQQTVKSHVRNAMRKLRAHTRAQLVAIALCSGQIVYMPHLRERSAEDPPEAGWSTGTG